MFFKLDFLKVYRRCCDNHSYLTELLKHLTYSIVLATYRFQRIPA